MFVGAEQENFVVGFELFIRAGVDDAFAVALDADDAGASFGAKLGLANELAVGGGFGGEGDGFQHGFMKHGGNGLGLFRLVCLLRVGEGFEGCAVGFGVGG